MLVFVLIALFLALANAQKEPNTDAMQYFRDIISPFLWTIHPEGKSLRGSQPSDAVSFVHSGGDVFTTAGLESLSPPDSRAHPKSKGSMKTNEYTKTHPDIQTVLHRSPASPESVSSPPTAGPLPHLSNFQHKPNNPKDYLQQSKELSIYDSPTDAQIPVQVHLNTNSGLSYSSKKSNVLMSGQVQGEYSHESLDSHTSTQKDGKLLPSFSLNIKQEKTSILPPKHRQEGDSEVVLFPGMSTKNSQSSEKYGNQKLAMYSDSIIPAVPMYSKGAELPSLSISGREKEINSFHKNIVQLQAPTTLQSVQKKHSDFDNLMPTSKYQRNMGQKIPHATFLNRNFPPAVLQYDDSGMSINKIDENSSGLGQYTSVSEVSDDRGIFVKSPFYH